MNIPFISWDGAIDLSGTVEQTKLEKHFGPTTVVFNTYQNAFAAILEVIGTRSHIIPVVMSVTSSPDLIAGALRAGADPVLLDIDPVTLQIDPQQLREVLDEVKAAVVVLSRPGGSEVDQDLLDMCAEMPTILDSRLMPNELDLERMSVCTFNIFSLDEIIGTGAVVIHKYSDQVRELKMVRNGILGLAANLPELLCAEVSERIYTHHAIEVRVASQSMLVEFEYMNKLPSFCEWHCNWPYFTVKVENADRVIAHLHSHGITAMKPVYPLHYLSDINRRWTEKPSYPVAESLTNKLVALPTTLANIEQASIIIEKVLEVDNGQKED